MQFPPEKNNIYVTTSTRFTLDGKKLGFIQEANMKFSIKCDVLVDVELEILNLGNDGKVMVDDLKKIIPHNMTQEYRDEGYRIVLRNIELDGKGVIFNLMTIKQTEDDSVRPCTY